MKKKSAPPPSSNQPCAVEGCKEPGDYKAPKSRDFPGEHQFLCLEHIRKFNAAWNYFDGWSRDEIESFMHSVVHGHRPTWKIGAQPHFTSEQLRESFYKMMGEDTPKQHKPETAAERKEREALATLNLEPGALFTTIKSQYKKLVKKYHPDVNRGDKASEEMFKRITSAYKLLSEIYGSSHEE